MRVNQSPNPSIQNTQTEGLKKSEQSAKTEKSKSASEIYKSNATDTSKGVKPEISAKGREFAAAHAVASATPDVREDKIADLKKRIAEGKYNVDSDQIADKMISDHSSL